MWKNSKSLHLILHVPKHTPRQYTVCKMGSRRAVLRLYIYEHVCLIMKIQIWNQHKCLPTPKENSWRHPKKVNLYAKQIPRGLYMYKVKTIKQTTTNEPEFWEFQAVKTKGWQRYFFGGCALSWSATIFFTCACASSLIFPICQCAMRYSAIAEASHWYLPLRVKDELLKITRNLA